MSDHTMPRPHNTPPSPAGSARFRLEDLADCWRIHGVKYRDSIWRVDLGKALLDNGVKKTQDEWIAYSRHARQRGKPYVGNAALQHSLYATLHDNKNSPQYKQLIRQIRKKALQQDFKHDCRATLTGVTYQPRESDRVIHDIGLPSEYAIEADVAGQNQCIRQGNNTAALDALLGDSDPQHIGAVYKWVVGGIIGQTVSFWRLQHKPLKIDERAVVLGVCLDDFFFGLYADNCMGDYVSARGVSAQKVSD